MTTEEKTLLAVLTLAAVLVPVGFSAALDWPKWSWLLLTVPLLGAVGLVVKNIMFRVQQEKLWQPYAAPAGVEQQEQARQTQIPDVTLPTAVDGYDFHFSATAYWRPTRGSRTQHTNLSDVASGAIVDRAKTIIAMEQPNRVDVVQYQLASALGAVHRDASTGVETWADHVQLTLSEADQERLRRYSDASKNKDLWEHEHDHERRKRDYLRDDVLQSTGSAITWWLARKDNDVEDTVRLIGALAQLSAAVHDREVPERFRHLVPIPATAGRLHVESLDGEQRFPNGSLHPWSGLPAGQFSDVTPVASQWHAFMDTLPNFGDEHERALLTRHFSRLLEKVKKPDAAQEIRRHCDAPTTDQEPAHLPEPDADPLDRPVPEVQNEPWRNSPAPGESEQNRQPHD
ncbi:MAG: hypothetical protein ACRDSR_02830 [Pseudonocardiaceae bacterium]